MGEVANNTPTFSEAAIEGAEKRFPDGTLDWFQTSDFFVDCTELVLLDQIAKGAFGTVYKGTFNGDTVAVKVEDFHREDEEQINLLVELTILQSLPHDRLVRFYGAGYLIKSATSLKTMMVLELCIHGALRECLKEDLPWNLRVRICFDIALGLAFLHEQGIIHRDIKSTNVLIDEHWRAKLCDFSFSCHDSSTTKDMFIYGTEEFMSPEVALAMAFGLPSDIFSFGIMLCEVITGIEPSLEFLNRRPQDMFAVDEGEIRENVLKDCPEELLSLTLQCCNLEPACRPSAEACVAELSTMLDTLGGGDFEYTLEKTLFMENGIDTYTSPFREGHVSQPPLADNQQTPTKVTPVSDLKSSGKSVHSTVTVDNLVNRMSFLEMQVQELRAENTRLDRELHALVSLTSERAAMGDVLNMSGRNSRSSSMEDGSRMTPETPLPAAIFRSPHTSAKVGKRYSTGGVALASISSPKRINSVMGIRGIGSNELDKSIGSIQNRIDTMLTPLVTSASGKSKQLEIISENSMDSNREKSRKTLKSPRSPKLPKSPTPKSPKSPKAHAPTSARSVKDRRVSLGMQVEDSEAILSNVADLMSQLNTLKEAVEEQLSASKGVISADKTDISGYSQAGQNTQLSEKSDNSSRKKKKERNKARSSETELSDQTPSDTSKLRSLSSQLFRNVEDDDVRVVDVDMPKLKGEGGNVALKSSAPDSQTISTKVLSDNVYQKQKGKAAGRQGYVQPSEPASVEAEPPTDLPTERTKVVNEGETDSSDAIHTGLPLPKRNRKSRSKRMSNSRSSDPDANETAQSAPQTQGGELTHGSTGANVTVADKGVKKANRRSAGKSATSTPVQLADATSAVATSAITTNESMPPSQDNSDGAGNSSSNMKSASSASGQGHRTPEKRSVNASQEVDMVAQKTESEIENDRTSHSTGNDKKKKSNKRRSKGKTGGNSNENPEGPDTERVAKIT